MSFNFEKQSTMKINKNIKTAHKTWILTLILSLFFFAIWDGRPAISISKIIETIFFTYPLCLLFSVLLKYTNKNFMSLPEQYLIETSAFFLIGFVYFFSISQVLQSPIIAFVAFTFLIKIGILMITSFTFAHLLVKLSLLKKPFCFVDEYFIQNFKKLSFTACLFLIITLVFFPKIEFNNILIESILLFETLVFVFTFLQIIIEENIQNKHWKSIIFSLLICLSIWSLFVVSTIVLPNQKRLHFLNNPILWEVFIVLIFTLFIGNYFQNKFLNQKQYKDELL